MEKDQRLRIATLTEFHLNIQTNPVPRLEIEVHCGIADAIQTLQVIWHDNDGHERYNLNYEYEMASKKIHLSGASVWDLGGGGERKHLFGFKNDHDGGFGFFYYDSDLSDRNFIIARTVSGNSQNLEYAVAVDSTPANDTWTPDSIAYGSDFADDFERVCALGFKSTGPTYSVDPGDCGTASKIAVADDWLSVAGFSSGSGGWTSDYLDGLFLLEINN